MRTNPSFPLQRAMCVCVCVCKSVPTCKSQYVRRCQHSGSEYAKRAPNVRCASVFRAKRGTSLSADCISCEIKSTYVSGAPSRQHDMFAHFKIGPGERCSSCNVPQTVSLQACNIRVTWALPLLVPRRFLENADGRGVYLSP